MALQQSTAPSETTRKLGGWELYRDVMKSPKHIVAPMVDQSELAWRILSRRYGGQLVYTPMINAGQFAAGNKKKAYAYRVAAFNTEEKEEGGPTDRPLIVQFAANDPQALLKSAKIIEPFCDAVDINFGCPQDIARKGRYGAYLCEDWDLIHKLISILHENLSIPVTAKFRIFPEVERTVRYAKMMESAGAQILTCHGRTRDQRGHKSGLADWSQIQAVKNAVSVPVFANGNVLYPEDVEKCLAFTGADAYMSAEPQLHNPAIFMQPPPFTSHTPATSEEQPSTSTAPPIPSSPPKYIPHAALAIEYLEIVASLKTRTTPSAVKAHMFKLMGPALARETDLRDRLGRATSAQGISEYMEICLEMKRRMERDAAEAGWDANSPGAYDFATDPETGLKDIPHWLAQPRIRPPPPPPGMPTQPSKAKTETQTAAGTPAPSKTTTLDATTVLLPSASPSSSEPSKTVIPLAEDDDPKLEQDPSFSDPAAGEKRTLDETEAETAPSDSGESKRAKRS